LISFGSLIEYKGKSFQDEKIQLLIATLLPQFKIEIYKFEKTKHIIDKKNYYDLGLLNEEQKDRTLIILEELKVSDIIGLNVDKKTKNLINFNIRIKDNDLNKKKKNEKEKYESYNLIVDLSSSKDAKEFFKSFKKMSEDYKSFYKKKQQKNKK
jgi:hypothetical protein